MTLNVYTIVWNEEFMLPHFLDHYSQFANRIFVIDDHSTDLTAQIAKAHPMVSYHKYPFEGLDEDEFNDTFYSFYKNNPSDWAVVADCDEFVYGLPSLGMFPGKVFKTKGYMMVGKTGRLEDCKPIRFPKFDKPIVFDPSLDIRFGDGRHTVNKPTREMDLTLYHYKYPSREYYYERNIKSYPRIMDEKQADYRIKRGLDWYDRHV